MSDSLARGYDNFRVTPVYFRPAAGRQWRHDRPARRISAQARRHAARRSRCRATARAPSQPAAASSSSSTTPAACTGTSGWNATACWSPSPCPRGLPRDRARNNLAKHTEDHPLEYLDFSGEIPAGEYGGGRMTISRPGHLRDRQVARRRDRRDLPRRAHQRAVRLLPDRRQGLDGPPDGPGRAGLGADAGDGRADAGHPAARACPPDDADWGYELSWGGRRIAGVRLRWSGPAAGRRRRRRDLVVPGDPADGRRRWRRSRRCWTARSSRSTAPGPAPELLARRKPPQDSAAARRAAERTPGAVPGVRPAVARGALHSGAGPVRRTARAAGRAVHRRRRTGRPRPISPVAATFALEAARAQGLAGIVAKRLDSPYLPGGSKSAMADRHSTLTPAMPSATGTGSPRPPGRTGYR